MALLKIDPGIIIWTWITFLLVLAVLGASTWKIILKGLNARADKIQEDLEEAEKTRENAKKSLAAYREQIDNAKRVRDKIIGNAREEAESHRNKILSEIDRAKDEAMGNVRKQAVDIAVVMAETILKRNIDKNDNQALINEFVNNFEKDNNK